MNRDNLAQLADYLDALPPDYDRFWMDVYCIGCGTVACALGHGPAAGIGAPSEDPYSIVRAPIFSWPRYCEQHFFGPDEADGQIWRFLFGPEWACIDNSPQGAAARIHHVIKHGMPMASFERGSPMWVGCGPWIRGGPITHAQLDRFNEIEIADTAARIDEETTP